MANISPKTQRCVFLACTIISVAILLAVVLIQLKENIIYFYVPREISQAHKQSLSPLRLGGVVKENSYALLEGNESKVFHAFVITDGQCDIPVRYGGVLPDLFRENQGVIAQGFFQSNTFMAERVLTKHDEVYMPPEAEEKIRRLRRQQKGKDHDS